MRLNQLLIILLTLLLTAFSALSVADNDQPLTLEVIDPFIEVRTGPGRGYPIFYLMEQGEAIDILVRRAQWYEIRGENGKVGWVNAAQLSRTLQNTGEPADLPSVSFGDYLKNQWRVGFSSGSFVAGDNAEIFTVSLSYRMYSWMGIEGEIGRVLDSDSQGRIQALNLLFEPFSQRRLSPEFILGSGKLSFESQPELGNIDNSNASFINYGLGLNYYLGRNFLVHGDYRWYPVSTNSNTVTLKSWKIGFSTFF